MVNDSAAFTDPKQKAFHFRVRRGTNMGLAQNQYLIGMIISRPHLVLNNELNILQALRSAGFQPYGQRYILSSIKTAVKQASGYTPCVECNNDSSGNNQSYQICLCVDSSASGFIKCPVFQREVVVPPSSFLHSNFHDQFAVIRFS